MTHPDPIWGYLNVRQAYAPDFSADGRHIRFLTDITGLPQVWQVAPQAGTGLISWPDQLTFAPDRVMGLACSPAPGDDRLVYARDVGGDENAQLFLLDAATGSERCLTAGHEAAMHIPGQWSADGQRILFAANRRHPALFDLYVQAVDGEARLVWQNDAPGYLFQARFAPDGRRAAVVRVAASFDHALFEVDLETGTARQLLVTDGRVRFPAAQYAADGKTLYLLTDLDADMVYLAALDLENGQLTRLVAPDWDCECLALSHDGRMLAYAVNVEGAHELYALDLETGQTRRMPPASSSPGLIADGRLVFSPDDGQLAFSFTSATRTADILVWDLITDRVHAVTRSSHGVVPVSFFVAPELIHYPTFDQAVPGHARQIPAWFYRPAQLSASPLPAVVLVHGGPEGQSRPGFHFLIQYLARHGYAVLVPNVRGSTGYGKRYSHLDDVEKRMDSVADLAHAAHWLKAQPGINPDRLVVYGGSYGGFMVLSALTAYPDLWAAGVDIVGISNLATFLENTSAYRRPHREAEYGRLARDRDFLERIAPINHIDRVTAPLMVIHGANDPRVPLSEAEQLVQALEARDVPVELLVFDDEGHGIVKLKNKQVAYPAIVAFLQRHV